MRIRWRRVCTVARALPWPVSLERSRARGAAVGREGSGRDVVARTMLPFDGGAATRWIRTSYSRPQPFGLDTKKFVFNIALGLAGDLSGTGGWRAVTMPG